MRKIVAAYMTYNSAGVIEASLNSVIELVDYAVIVDGALLGHPDPHDHSIDGTIEIAREIIGRKGIIIKPRRRLTEPQTRNVLVQIVNSKFPGSWLFMVDADEVLHDAAQDFEYLSSKASERYHVALIRRNDTEYNHMYSFQLYAGIRERTSLHPLF